MVNFNVLNAFKIKSWGNILKIIFKLGTHSFSLDFRPCQTSCRNLFPESPWMLLMDTRDLREQMAQKSPLLCAPSCLRDGLWTCLCFTSWTLRCASLGLTGLPSIRLWQSPERHLSGWQRSLDCDVLTLPRQLCIIHSSLTWAKKGKPFNTASC